MSLGMRVQKIISNITGRAPAKTTISSLKPIRFPAAAGRTANGRPYGSTVSEHRSIVGGGQEDFSAVVNIPLNPLNENCVWDIITNRYEKRIRRKR